jgi:hypothetical protein
MERKNGVQTNELIFARRNLFIKTVHMDRAQGCNSGLIIEIKRKQGLHRALVYFVKVV